MSSWAGKAVRQACPARPATGATDTVARSLHLVTSQWFDAPWPAIPHRAGRADRPPLRAPVGRGAVEDCTLKVRRSCFTQRSMLIMRWPVRVLPAPALLVAEAFTAQRRLTSILAPSSVTLRLAAPPTPAAAFATTEI